MTFITTIQRKKLVVKISYFYNTDHSVYEIETNNVYEDLYMIKVCLILVNIQINQNFYDVKKKKVISKMQDETKGIPIVEFVG